MNIRVDENTFICNPHVIEFKEIEKADGKRLVLMVDEFVAKTYKDWKQAKEDRSKIDFSIGLTEPVCNLTEEENDTK